MNVVSARRPQYGFGQAIDPSTGIIADIQLGPEDTGPVFTDPNITYGAGSGAPPISYQPSVPQPPSSSSVPGFTFPTGTVQQLFPQGLPPGPAPRVYVPLSAPGGLSMWFKNNLPLALGLGAAVLILPGLVAGGRRRR